MVVYLRLRHHVVDVGHGVRDLNAVLVVLLGAEANLAGKAVDDAGLCGADSVVGVAAAYVKGKVAVTVIEQYAGGGGLDGPLHHAGGEVNVLFFYPAAGLFQELKSSLVLNHKAGLLHQLQGAAVYLFHLLTGEEADALSVESGIDLHGDSLLRCVMPSGCLQGLRQGVRLRCSRLRLSALQRFRLRGRRQPLPLPDPEGLLLPGPQWFPSWRTWWW